MTDSTKALLPAPVMQNLHDPSGIGYADTIDPHVPLSVRVGPYVTIAAGDIIDLMCDGELAFNYTVREEDLTPETPSFVVLPLDQKFIHPDQITLSYKVTEPIGGLQNESLPRAVLVKLTIPGGIDTNPATPWENEALAKPLVFPEGVITSPEGVSVQIAAYLNMSVGDRITLSWNGQFVRSVVTESDALDQPLTIDIPKEIITAAGDSDMLEVRYEIRDLVNNWSRWSLPASVNVEVGEGTLPAPLAPQAPNMELDLNVLAGAPVQVLVLSNPQISNGDEVVLSVERNTAEGMPLETYKVAKVVTNEIDFLEFMVPNGLFAPISQGRARLKYHVAKSATSGLESKSLPLKIVGQPMELLPPRIPAADQNNGILDPATPDVIVEVPPYHFMMEGHDVNLVWMGKTAAGAHVMYEDLKNLSNGDLNKPLNFLIPDEKVNALAGGFLDVYYTITSFEREFFKSPTLQVVMGADTSIYLPRPSIDELGSDGVLDPAMVVLEATVRIAHTGQMVEKDIVTLHWDGQGVEGSYSDFTVINSGTVGRDVTFRVNKRHIEPNVDHEVTVWYDVERNNQRFLSEPLRFRVGSIVYPVLPAPTLKEAVDDILDPAAAVDGATLQIAADAKFREGETITAHWNGPKGSDSREKTIRAEEVGLSVSTVFAAALVTANDGQTIEVSYSVKRGSGVVQESSAVAYKVMSATLELPAPTMDTVGPDGVLRPSLIPQAGATVRVAYRGMEAGDEVTVNWAGQSTFDTPAQVVGASSQLSFIVPKALITATEGADASVTYSVVRGGVSRVSEPLQMGVHSGLELDTSSVVLAGKIYLLPGYPDLLPSFPSGTTVQREVSGGQAPYSWTSSDPTIAHVDGLGLVSVRRNGGAVITVSDAAGESKSYNVAVTGVIECHGVGSGNLTQMSNKASGVGGRIPSIHELIEIYNTYGSRWPMGKGNYWSSTVAKDVFGAKWYYVKNLVGGGDFKLLHINNALGVAVR